MKKNVLMALIIALAVSLPRMATAQSVAVKTNLVYAASATPNIGLEAKLSGHWTAGISAGLNPFSYSDNKKMKHLLVAPQGRYWFCEAFAGHFAGINAAYAHYNAGNIKMPFGLYGTDENERHQGDMVAVGASYGYSWILSPRWSIEAEAGCDLGWTWYDRYDCARCGTFRGDDSKALVLPWINVGIIYNIK